MVIDHHVIQSAAKNLPSTGQYVSRRPLTDGLVRGPIAFVAASPCIRILTEEP